MPGVRAGDAISPHYDPMIAKLIVWGDDRDMALARMRAALADTHIVGVANNVDFLSRLLANHAFARAQFDTGLIERERDNLFAPEDRLPEQMLALACARVLADEAQAAGADPWSSTTGWRLNAPYRREMLFRSDRGVHEVAVEYGRGGHVFGHGGHRYPLAIEAARGTRLTVRLADRTLQADVVRDPEHAGEDLHVFVGGRHRALTLVDLIAHAGDSATVDGSLAAPMPGRVIAVHVAPGARVTRGSTLLVMEAMKMEHAIIAPADGVVEDILFSVGDQVAEGAALVAFTPVQ
jgi:Acetyl/propionyl-CoA carboxylase, alpha subunit